MGRGRNTSGPWRYRCLTKYLKTEQQNGSRDDVSTMLQDEHRPAARICKHHVLPRSRARAVGSCNNRRGFRGRPLHGELFRRQKVGSGISRAQLVENKAKSRTIEGLVLSARQMAPAWRAGKRNCSERFTDRLGLPSYA